MPRMSSAVVLAVVDMVRMAQGTVASALGPAMAAAVVGSVVASAAAVLPRVQKLAALVEVVRMGEASAVLVRRRLLLATVLAAKNDANHGYIKHADCNRQASVMKSHSFVVMFGLCCQPRAASSFWRPG